MSRPVHQLVPAELKEVPPHPDLQTLLGPPLLLEGEDAAAYAALNQRIRDAVVPKDIIEDIWVLDVVDLVWEAMRLRRFKAKFMKTSADALIGGYVRAWTTDPEEVPSLMPPEPSELAEGWNRQTPASIAKVNALLKERHIDQEEIATRTFVANLDTLERIDRMIMQAEARRNSVLREIERRRGALAQRLREAAATIEDGEFREISAHGGNRK